MQWELDDGLDWLFAPPFAVPVGSSYIYLKHIDPDSYKGSPVLERVLLTACLQLSIQLASEKLKLNNKKQKAQLDKHCRREALRRKRDVSTLTS